MSVQKRDHQTAIGWIEGEIDNMVRDLGKPNASSAATSVITLAYLLRIIDDNEHRRYRARIDEIYATYNESIKQRAVEHHRPPRLLDAAQQYL
jgi:RNA:NAD 2'-phosphotransferase (TPT1/KptA family)